MRFPRGNAAFEPEDYLGEFACALEARLACRSRAVGAAAEQPRLWFQPAALDETELSLLRGAEEAALLTRPGGLAQLSIARALLLELAGRSPAARCLAAALEAASAPPSRPLVMGILNVTPDSFSDGGAFLETARAVEQGAKLIAEGADLVDVGGESTRPGSEPVSASVELQRVLPVLAGLGRGGHATLSIDTTKAQVARAALDAGASVINDVSAGRNDPELLGLAAERKAGLILMHTQGAPRDMQRGPHYEDIVREVAAHLRLRARAAWKAGVEPARIALDPGLGFGKLLEHNLELMRALPELRSLGFPLCLGVSRKSFLGRLTGHEHPGERQHETTAAVTLGAYLGAEIHRVHEVAPARSALDIAWALTADRRA